MMASRLLKSNRRAHHGHNHEDDAAIAVVNKKAGTRKMIPIKAIFGRKTPELIDEDDVAPRSNSTAAITKSAASYKPTSTTERQQQRGDVRKEKRDGVVHDNDDVMSTISAISAVHLTKKSAKVIDEMDRVTKLRLRVDSYQNETFEAIGKRIRGNNSLQKIEIYRATTVTEIKELQKRGTYRTLNELIWLFDIIAGLPNLKELKLKNFYLLPSANAKASASLSSSSSSSSSEEDDDYSQASDESSLSDGSAGRIKQRYNTTDNSKKILSEADVLRKFLLKPLQKRLRKLHFHHATTPHNSGTHNKIPDKLFKTIAKMKHLEVLTLEVGESYPLSKLLLGNASSSDSNDYYGGGSAPSTLRELHIIPTKQFEYSSDHFLSLMNLIEASPTTTTAATGISPLVGASGSSNPCANLKVLDLGYKGMITGFMVRVMAYALRENTTLESLKFSFTSDTEYNKMSKRIEESSKSLKELANALSMNNTLVELRNYTSDSVLVNKGSLEDLFTTLQKHNSSIMEFEFCEETPSISAHKQRILEMENRGYERDGASSGWLW